MAKKLMVVIPCYNEEEVLPETSKRLIDKMQSLMDKGMISADSRVLLVDDGSKDRTFLPAQEITWLWRKKLLRKTRSTTNGSKEKIYGTRTWPGCSHQHRKGKYSWFWQYMRDPRRTDYTKPQPATPRI